jgi:hypothetical protein
MDKNKELNVRTTLMQSKEWREVISKLKELKVDNQTKNYVIVYKKENQRKDWDFKFNKVEYVEETKNFIFTSFKVNQDCSLSDEITSREVLLDIEIIELKIIDKPVLEETNILDYCLF